MRHLTMLWLPVIVILVAAECASAGSCMQLRDKPGYTVPPGDITVEIGKPLEILCVLNPEHEATAGTNASDIVFERHGSPVPDEYVQVVNSTTARLYIDRAEPVDSSYYYCRLKPSGRKPTAVCMNLVAIGYPPRDLKIENFTCISRHLKNLNCTWQVPENPIKTTYSINYTYGLLETRHLNSFPCPDPISPNFGYCYWDENTDPMYREKDEMYYFKITAENALGNHTFEEIEFNQWAHALLDKPEFLNGSALTTNSVYLHWEIDPHLKPVPLKYKLLYKSATSECDVTDEWKQVDTSDFNWKRSSYNLTDLPYANFLYDVRLYIAPAKSTGDDMWSKPASFTFRTEPMPPASPPELAPGSFQVIGKESMRDVLIFWKRLPRCQENGDNFRYKVVAKEIGASKQELEDAQPKLPFAKFSNLSLNAYEVSVYAVNKEGSSKPAVILIPEKKQMPPQASRIATVVKENGLVQLTWDSALPEVETFTVFWCQNEQLSSVHCTGLLNSTVVGREKAEATIQTRPGKVYEFGVAVNAGPFSSGIAWVACTVRPDSVYGRVSTPTVSKIGDTFLEIRFKVDCLNGLKTAHYLVHYCAIDDPEKPECRGPMATLPVSTNSTDVLVTVAGLWPYTTYRLSVVPADKDGRLVGDRSEWLNTTTMDATPSPPRDLTVEEVTGDSAVVSWRRPLRANGRLQAYLVSYGAGELRVTPEYSPQGVLAEVSRAKLPDLDGDTAYSVNVSACTSRGCAPAERAVELRTRVGRPGAVRRVSARPQAGGRLELAWSPPQPAGGPRHLFQALLLEPASGRNWTLPLPRNLSAALRVPACDADADASYRVAVRALNLDEANDTLPGPWSDWTDAYCGAAGGLQKGRVLLWCVGTLCVLGACAALVIGGRRLARWWRLARGVQVKLPPGLAPPPADKRDRDEERRVRTPWLLYGGEKAAVCAGAEPPESPTHEETTLLRGRGGGGGGVARCDSGGGGSTSSAGTGSDCALSSLTSATTAASDSDGDADAEAEAGAGAAAGKPRAARQWSTFSDGSVSRSTPNLWEAEAAPPPADRPPGYCRAGLAEPPAAGYVTVASAPYVRRGSLDGWPHTVAVAAAAPAIPAGYTQMGANNELVPVAELKAPLAIVHNLKGNNDRETSRGYVPRPVEAAPTATNQQLVLTPLTQWAPNHNHNNNNTVPYVTAARPPVSTPDHARYQQQQQQQNSAAMWPSIRCEMPAAASPAPAPARGYVSVDHLPPPPASSAPAAPGASPSPAGYVVCSSGRPPDGYVSAGPPPAVSSPAQTPAHHCKPGGPYVLLGEVTTGGGLPPPPPPPAAAVARGYVSLQQLQRT